MNDATMRCRDAVDRLWEYIDHELDAATAEQVCAHLELCQDCFPHYDFQRAYREFMARCAGGCAPPELRRKIFLSLLEEEKH